MDNKREIVAVVHKHGLHEKCSDFRFWQSQPPEARIAALELIRSEFHQWRNIAQPGLQRVYSIVKRK